MKTVIFIFKKLQKKPPLFLVQKKVVKSKVRPNKLWVTEPWLLHTRFCQQFNLSSISDQFKAKKVNVVFIFIKNIKQKDFSLISSINHLIHFSYFVVTFQKENNFPFDSPATTTDWLLLNYRQLFENYDWIIDSRKYLFSGIDVNIQNCMILVCI